MVRNHPALLWSEATFQSQVIQLAKQLGFKQIYHVYDSRRSEPGFPDLVMVNARTRRTLFIELKTQKGRISPEQVTWIDALRVSGQTAMVWRPSDWVSGRILNVLSGRESNRGN
ncbi:VRR-NUC domain-containing protein [Glutamicibacter soli]